MLKYWKITFYAKFGSLSEIFVLFIDLTLKYYKITLYAEFNYLSEINT